MTGNKAPAPITRERALQIIKDEGFTACQQAKRYKAEYNRKITKGQNEYTDRLKQYADIFATLCQEERDSKKA